MKRIFLLCTALLACVAARAEIVKGSVRSTDGKAVAGVVVSDGLNSVQTDKNGAFTLDADGDSRWVFISTPSGYRSSVTPGELEYYKKLLKGVE